MDPNIYGYVQNNPTNKIDSYGLMAPSSDEYWAMLAYENRDWVDPTIRWGEIAKGGIAVTSGIILICTGTCASTTGVGATIGVPMVISGAAGFGWGVSRIIIGTSGHELILPKPSAAALVTLVATGDVDQACIADAAQDIVLLGASIGKMAEVTPKSFELVGAGLDFVQISIEAESLKNQFRKNP
jgi:hypothetical protein